MLNISLLMMVIVDTQYIFLNTFKIIHKILNRQKKLVFFIYLSWAEIV